MDIYIYIQSHTHVFQLVQHCFQQQDPFEALLNRWHKHMPPKRCSTFSSSTYSDLDIPKTKCLPWFHLTAVSFWYIVKTDEVIPGSPKVHQFRHGWKWLFPTISYVQICCIIQLIANHFSGFRCCEHGIIVYRTWWYGGYGKSIPRDPITLSDDEQGVYNHLRNAVNLDSVIIHRMWARILWAFAQDVLVFP